MDARVVLKSDAILHNIRRGITRGWTIGGNKRLRKRDWVSEGNVFVAMRKLNALFEDVAVLVPDGSGNWIDNLHIEQVESFRYNMNGEKVPYYWQDLSYDKHCGYGFAPTPAPDYCLSWEQFEKFLKFIG